jgi:hypothetical protein
MLHAPSHSLRVRSLARLTAILLGTMLTTPAASQLLDDAAVEAYRGPEAPQLFLDCPGCDVAHIRSEVTFVNHVRDASAADVHVLVTHQPTGAGGRLYTLAFLGRRSFHGVNQTLTYTSRPGNTSSEERDGLTAMLKLGLVPYAAGTPVGERLDVRYRPAPSRPAQSVDDAWRSWTFEVYGGGNYNTESTQDVWNARYGFYVNRVTADWKVRFRPYFNHNARTIRRQDADDIRINQRRHGVESYLIRSAGPHMGTGVFVDYTTNTLDNVAHGVTVTPAVEYSVFPYTEATRRSVTFTYRIGYELVDYLEETIYEKTAEALLNHSLNASVQTRQPWGSISSGITAQAYLHDTRFHRLAANGTVSFRIGGGVSLNVGGSYQRINDQLGLPRRDASIEDILLQRRRLATAYRGAANVGLSYTFGSLFSNVVNPRL